MAPLFWILLGVVLLAIVGLGTIIGFAWPLIAYVAVGAVIGGLGRLLVAGTSGIGILPTLLAGLIGSVAGGIIAETADLGRVLGFVVSVLIAAVAVAIVVMRSGDEGAGPAGR